MGLKVVEKMRHEVCGLLVGCMGVCIGVAVVGDGEEKGTEEGRGGEVGLLQAPRAGREKGGRTWL